MNEQPRAHAAEPPGDDPLWSSPLVPAGIVAIAVLAVIGLVFVSQREQDAGASALRAASVDPAALPVTVPYRDVAGAIVIDVGLGEDGPTVPMLLDTGAPTIVAGHIADLHAGEPVGTIAVTTPDGQVLSSDVVTLRQLRIGEAVFREVGAVVAAIEPGNPFYCLSQAGFVGASLMQTAVWQIDPLARTLTIAASSDGLGHVDGVPALDMTPASSVSPSPLIELPAGGGELTVLLDSGSDGWLAINPGDLAAIGVELAADAPSQRVLGTTAGGPFTAQVRWAAAELGLAGRAEPVPIATSDVLPAGQGIAGTDLLSRFVVTVDWLARRVWLDPIAPLEPSTPPAATVAWDDGFVVGSHVDGGPASGALRLGTAVTAIDGEDVTGATFGDFCGRLLDGPASSTLTLGDRAATVVDARPREDFFEPLWR